MIGKTDFELMEWRPVYNAGNTTIGSFELCRVYSDNSQERSIVSVCTPDSTLGIIYAVNGPIPLAPGEFGRACFGPIVLVAYNTGTPTLGSGYGPVSGSGKVVVNQPACIITIRIVDSTNKIMLAHLVPITKVIGVLDDTLSTGSSATVSVYSGVAGDEEDTGLDIIAYDYLLELDDDDLAAGKKVCVELIDGVMYVVSAYLTRGAGGDLANNVQFAVAQQNWETSGGVCGYPCVLAKRVTTFDGVTPLTYGDSFYISLPPNNARDPNVVTGQIVAYRYVAFTAYMAVGGDYLDEKIGTIKLSAAATYNEGTGYYDPVIPAGWALFEEATDKFIKGAGITETVNPATGTAGGDDETSEETTGITIADHPHHIHDPSADEFHSPNTGGSYYPANSYTGPELDPDGSHDPVTLSHPVTDPGHTHTNDPPNVRMWLLIRVNNSI